MIARMIIRRVPRTGSVCSSGVSVAVDFGSAAEAVKADSAVAII